MNEALTEFDRFMTPPPDQVIIGWLAKLSALCASRKRDDAEIDILIEAYVEQLRSYPADVVRHALFGEKWKWWPTWAELADVIEPLVSHRRVMREALQRPQHPDEEPERDTEEQIAARARMKKLTDETLLKMRAGLPKRGDAPMWTPEEAAKMREATKPEVELARLRSKKFHSIRLTEAEELRLAELTSWEREALK